jgi:hypothetical protein
MRAFLFSVEARTGGAEWIRTLGTGLNGARADVCASCRDSIFYPETEGQVVLRHCRESVRFPVQSKGEWLAILWLKVVSTTPLTLLSVAIVFPSPRRLNLMVRPEIAHV